jgi:hypothetical protein
MRLYADLYVLTDILDRVHNLHGVNTILKRASELESPSPHYIAEAPLEWAITPKPGNYDSILQRIYEAWCNGNEKDYWYVIGWLARMFQHPNEPGATILALPQRVINPITKLLLRAVGKHATKGLNDPAGRVFIYAGHVDSAAQVKRLRHLVMAKEHGKPRVPNHCHVIMTYQGNWKTPPGLDDRRFVVLNGGWGFGSGEFTQAGQQAFIHYLLSLDITGFDLRSYRA